MTAADSPRRIVVLAGSAGAIPDIVRVLRRLREPDGACLFIVYHRGKDVPYDWERHLPPGSAFRGTHVRDGASIEANTVYYPEGPNDFVVRHGALRVERPRGRYHPNIDRLLGSLALEYGAKVVPALLSGLGNDGVAGLAALRQAGAETLALDPAQADFGALPAAAIQAGAVARTLGRADLVARLTAVLAPPSPGPSLGA